MVSYIYMLLITVIAYLWQGIAKEQVDFFKMASNNISINIKYDYLYTTLEKANDLCNSGSCISSMRVMLPDYKYSHEAKICKNGGDYYAFYSDPILTEKPPVSLPDNSGFSLIDVNDIPITCKTNVIGNNKKVYALKYTY
ncbi:hypothetical protein Q5512_25095 [Escherichia coli]|nr:hypothetical protein [Escherichia coli]